MIANKTFFGQSLAKKSNRISPVKQKGDKKVDSNKCKSIVKLPLVKHSNHLEHKNYQFGEVIGEGAFAKVHEAKRISDDKKCVIKVIQKSKLNTQQRRKSFKRELQALGLPKHKNLVNAIDQFEVGDTVCIVMEYFTSTSISQFIKLNRPLDNSTLQKITKQICQGLIYLHSYGISHRDIKPQNILIDQNLNVKIIDFGFATTGQLDEVVVAGTPQFMAPELVARKNYDPLKADIWSFGIMLYWMALGYYPQQADSKKKKSSKKGQQLHLHFPVDMNPGLQYLLRKMLNPNPKQRIQLIQMLEDTWIKPKLFKAEIDRLKNSKSIQTPLSIA